MVDGPIVPAHSSGRGSPAGTISSEASRVLIVPCRGCGTKIAAKRSTKRFCESCALVRRGRSVPSRPRPEGISYGQQFKRSCLRCGCEVLALRASKRYCDSCLADHRKPVREQSRSARAHKLRKVGLTLREYDAMVYARKGRCDICGNVPTNQNGSLCVDHDHLTGKLRGLLCSPCNRAIGLLGDTSAAIAKAYLYLSNAEGSEGGAA